MRRLKSFLAIILTVFFTVNVASAADTANIKINISAPSKINKYFLCFPGTGCFSILAANEGKVYPLLRSFRIENIFLANVANFRTYGQGLPASCKVKVDTKQTVTISGKIVEGANGEPHVAGLSCKVS